MRHDAKPVDGSTLATLSLPALSLPSLSLPVLSLPALPLGTPLVRELRFASGAWRVYGQLKLAQLDMAARRLDEAERKRRWSRIHASVGSDLYRLCASLGGFHIKVHGRSRSAHRGPNRSPDRARPCRWASSSLAGPTSCHPSGAPRSRRCASWLKVAPNYNTATIHYTMQLHSRGGCAAG